VWLCLGCTLPVPAPSSSPIPNPLNQHRTSSPSPKTNPPLLPTLPTHRSRHRQRLLPANRPRRVPTTRDNNLAQCRVGTDFGLGDTAKSGAARCDAEGGFGVVETGDARGGGEVMGGMGDVVKGCLGGDERWVCGIVAWGAVIWGVGGVARTGVDLVRMAMPTVRELTESGKGRGRA
jgi:hypothetical protein